MSPEAQRIAIAEACGWSVDLRKSSGIEWTALVGPNSKVVDTTSGIASLKNFGCVPDYLSNLNAMHEAEKVLTDAQYHAYTLELSRLAWIKSPHQTDDHDYKERLRSSFSATAAQRAEALLRTLGKWDDTK